MVCDMLCEDCAAMVAPDGVCCDLCSTSQNPPSPPPPLYFFPLRGHVNKRARVQNLLSSAWQSCVAPKVTAENATEGGWTRGGQNKKHVEATSLSSNKLPVPQQLVALSYSAHGASV